MEGCAGDLNERREVVGRTAAHGAPGWARFAGHAVLSPPPGGPGPVLWGAGPSPGVSGLPQEVLNTSHTHLTPPWRTGAAAPSSAAPGPADSAREAPPQVSPAPPDPQLPRPPKMDSLAAGRPTRAGPPRAPPGGASRPARGPATTHLLKPEPRGGRRRPGGRRAGAGGRRGPGRAGALGRLFSVRGPASRHRKRWPQRRRAGQERRRLERRPPERLRRRRTRGARRAPALPRHR